MANRLASLVLRTPDKGANGTCNWDLAAFVDQAPAFPRLQTCIVAQNAPGDHNRQIIARVYTEDGVLGRLLHKAPHLQTLIVPSAPHATFFADRHAHLRMLSVDAGYDTQQFIQNLATYACFPALRTLEFGEFNETYLDDFPQGCTPFAAYQRLFMVAHFASVRSFVWRNPVCTAAEIAELRSIRTPSALQLTVINRRRRACQTS